MVNNSIKYPEEIRNRVENGMGCGSAIGEGWYDIIRELDKQIAELYPEYVVNQVKEKFGGLRYYIDDIPDEVHADVYDFINEAYMKANVSCDVCGAPGKIGNVSEWMIATRCEKHRTDK